MSNTYQKKRHGVAQHDPQPGAVTVPEQVVVSMTELASFYVDLAGWEIARKDPDWITCGPGRPGGRIPAGPRPRRRRSGPGTEHPQQFHLDLQIDGHQAAAERAVALGATRLADGPTWITLADPAGHPFDLCQRDGSARPWGCSP